MGIFEPAPMFPIFYSMVKPITNCIKANYKPVFYLNIDYKLPTKSGWFQRT